MPYSTTTTNINGVERGPREELLYDIQRVKKAGNFLEDIRIFLSGFNENEFEKIRLAIQTAGGVSLGQLTSSVTVSNKLPFPAVGYNYIGRIFIAF